MRFIYDRLRPYLLLIYGVSLIVFGLMSSVLPDLSGAKKGVSIKIHSNNVYKADRIITPRSKDFVMSKKLPKHVTGAIIVSEDEGFYSHNGVSLKETLDAAKYDIKYRTLKHGGSTITQQLVKNVYLSGERKFSRKIVEAITAFRLEQVLTKEQILDYYLNVVEFGHGIYGIKQASRYYFDKRPDQLTAKEAAMLAVTLPKPKARGKALLAHKTEEFQKKRVKRLLVRMRKQGFIS